jgi:hypothetical protein
MNDERFWLHHLKAIDASGLTTKAYGDQHKLSVKKLYEWRKHFVIHGVSGATNGRGAGNPFVAVQVKPSSVEAVSHCVVLCGSLRLEFDSLPPVQWLASLDVALRRVG